MILSNEEKFANNHLFRWFNYIQNLNGIKDNWTGDYVSFPKAEKGLEGELSKRQMKKANKMADKKEGKNQEQNQNKYNHSIKSHNKFRKIILIKK